MSHLALPTAGTTAVVRQARWPAFLGVLVLGAFEAGLVAAIVRAIATGRWAIDDTHPSTAEDVVGWTLCFAFALLVGCCLPVAVRLALVGRVVDRITTTEAVETVRGRQTTRIDLASATRIAYLPALRATWQRSTSSADTRRRWTSRGVGYDRLVVEGAGSRLEFSADGARWADVVNALEQWTAVRPELAADEPTRRLLATPFPRPHPWWRRWGGPIVSVLVVLAALSTLVVRSGDDGVSPGSLALSVVASSLLFGALLWAVVVRPVVEVLRGLGLVVRRRDPWALFAPDEHGRYSWLLDGRGATLLRAPERRTVVGLVARYLGVALYALLPAVVVGASGVKLWLLLH